MFAPIEPFAFGMLAVADGNSIYWECSGNPVGKPVLHLHGGPGAGMGAGYRRRFDPDRHLIVGYEQRGCGRSRPLVTDDMSSLAANNTENLINDIEALRQHLDVDRWLLAGVSWGTTLALAYAQTYPERVSEMVLLAITLTSASAVEWITETVGCLFPVEWDAYRAAANPRPGQRLVDAYYELLTDPDPAVRVRAAIAWDRWENAHISLDPHQQPGAQFIDPTQRQVFATLVVHLLETCRLPARRSFAEWNDATSQHPRRAHPRQARHQRSRRDGVAAAQTVVDQSVHSDRRRGTRWTKDDRGDG